MGELRDRTPLRRGNYKIADTGLRSTIRSGPASAWGPRWLALAGVALAAAGVFVIDPSPSYPPGAPPTTSWHGILHQVAGPLMFLGLTMTAFVYARRVARPYGVAVGVLIIALFFVGTNVLVTLSYASVWKAAPAGLLESRLVDEGKVAMARRRRSHAAVPARELRWRVRRSRRALDLVAGFDRDQRQAGGSRVACGIGPGCLCRPVLPPPALRPSRAWSCYEVL